MKIVLKEEHYVPESDSMLSEDVVFDTDKAKLIFENVEQCRFLWIRLKDHHKKLYLTASGNYVMERYYEGNESYYVVLSKSEAAQFVRDWDKDAYIRLFRPREL